MKICVYSNFFEQYSESCVAYLICAWLSFICIPSQLPFSSPSPWWQLNKRSNVILRPIFSSLLPLNFNFLSTIWQAISDSFLLFYLCLSVCLCQLLFIYLLILSWGRKADCIYSTIILFFILSVPFYSSYHCVCDYLTLSVCTLYFLCYIMEIYEHFSFNYWDFN